MQVGFGALNRLPSSARQDGRERSSLCDSRTIHAVSVEHVVECNYAFQFVDIAAVDHGQVSS